MRERVDALPGGGDYCERRGVTRIATLNHRDSAVVRPHHAAAFELLP